MTTPRPPSIMTVSPPFTSDVMSPRPTTAGMPIARATIAVWLVPAAAAAVDNARVAPLPLRRDVAGAEDGGDAHRAGDDRRVARPPADVGREALHVFPVERGRLAGQQVVDDDDDVARQVGQVLVAL